MAPRAPIMCYSWATTMSIMCTSHRHLDGRKQADRRWRKALPAHSFFSGLRSLRARCHSFVACAFSQPGSARGCVAARDIRWAKGSSSRSEVCSAFGGNKNALARLPGAPPVLWLPAPGFPSARLQRQALPAQDLPGASVGAWPPRYASGAARAARRTAAGRKKGEGEEK